MQFFRETKINFMGQWKTCLLISSILIAAGLISLVIKGGPAYNIDFSGGTLVQVRYSKDISVSEVRTKMKTLGFGDATIQQFGEVNDILIRVSAQKEAGIEEESVSDKIVRGLKSKEELDAKQAGKIDLNNIEHEKLLDFLNKTLASGENKTNIDTSSLADSVIEGRKNIGGIFSDITQVTKLAGFSEEIINKIKDKVYLGHFIIERVEMVGPKVGKDLRGKAFFSINCAIIALLIYITIRFELVFALGAVIATVHDVLITLGLFSLFDKEISLVVIAAFLALAGYSVNDTIVVFDRAKENFTKSKTKLNILDFDSKTCFNILNMSVNQTLSRTILTVGTTLFTVLALFLFGGAVIHDFAFALLVGIITGTYSSIYIASSLVYGINYFGRKRRGYIDTPFETKKAPPKPKIKKSKDIVVAANNLTEDKEFIEEKGLEGTVTPEVPVITNDVQQKRKTRGKSRTKERDKAKSKKKK